MEALAAECRAETWCGRGSAASVADKPGRGGPLAQRRPLGTARARWGAEGKDASLLNSRYVCNYCQTYLEYWNRRQLHGALLGLNRAWPQG